MAYTAVYSGTDLGNIFIDLFGTIVHELKDQAGTLVILLIVGLIAIYGKQALNAIFGIFQSLR